MQMFEDGTESDNIVILRLEVIKLNKTSTLAK